MTQQEPVLLVEAEDAIRILRLNRPEAANAANPELHRRLAEVWVELEEDAGCGAVVITGNGKAFCAGGDMNLLKRMNEDEQVRSQTLEEGKQIVRRLVRFPHPVIAAVNGAAVGLGCSLAGLSDIVLMEEDAYLADPHVSVGLVAADGGALTWPAMTSLLRAKEYLFTGDRIPAPVAVELGLANRIVPNGASLDEALLLARRLCAQPAQALMHTKQALNKVIERSVFEVLDFAIACEAITSASGEHRAIVDRFFSEAPETSRRSLGASPRDVRPLTAAAFSEKVEPCSTSLPWMNGVSEGGILDERRSFVAGTWVEGVETFPVENPADESIITELGATPIDEVTRAVTEARRAFDQGVWADLPAQERARVLGLLLDHLESLHDPLVASMVAEAGQPVLFAEFAQYTAGLMLARNTIDLYLALSHEEPNPVPTDELVRGRVALSLRRHEPVGVVVAITPYNGAIIMAFQKLIAALMAGNSVVLRPSPLTPISSLAFGAAAEASGLPAGVLSVVIEPGAAAAELLTTHPAVDMVSFTGSTAVGRQILAQAAPTVKRVALELGGKSAQIYLPDALHRVAAGASQVVAMTAGQACVAATRMLVPQEHKEEVLQAVGAAYAGMTVGPPSDQSAVMGPLITAAQRERCERIVAHAEEHGAKVVTGGGRPSGLERGYYFEPTVLDVPDNANPAAQEEIFGPVLSVIGYRDIDDAVRIANDSPYGLSGQVYGADVAAATAVARRIRTGAVNVNTSLFSAYAPSGGFKQSGLGRERGVEGIRAFQEIKHLLIGELPA